MVVPAVRSDRVDTFRPGDMISAYRVDGLVGSGGMGWVYRATHVLAPHVAALKVLRHDQLAQDHAVDRMMREATILASVAHPGMPQFFECGLLADGRPWIAMELVQGTPLQDVMAAGPLPHAAVRALLRDVAGVLSSAHARGVTHRDLKPDNVFLTPGDRRHGVRVIDWGIAHREAGARYTNHNEAIGTPTYMSPEQARGGQPDSQCDLYGLGVVAYEALVGNPPFVGQSSIEVLVQHLNKPVPALGPRCPTAPLALVDLVERMLSKHPPSRPTAAAVVEAMEALEADPAPLSTGSAACDRTGSYPAVIEDAYSSRTVPVWVPHK